MHHSSPHRHRLRTSARVGLFVVFGLMALTLLEYTDWSWRTNRPQRVAAPREVGRSELLLARAHLWLEEALTGDPTVDMAEVRRLLADSAQAAAQARQTIDDRTTLDESLAMTVPKLALLSEQIEQLRQLTDARWDDAGHAGPGSALDQTFDQLFAETQATADEVRSRLVAAGEQSLHGQAVLHRLVLGAWCAAVLLGAATLWYVDRRHVDLEAERNRLTNVLEQTTDLVGTVTPNGIVTYLNPAGQRLLGLDPTGLGAPLRVGAFYPAWAYERIAEVGIPAARKHGTWRGDTAVLRGDGREIPVSQVIIAHRDATGEVEHFSTIIRDTSEQSAAAEQLRRGEQRFRLAAQCASDLIYEWDVHSDALAWFGDIDAALGEPPGTIPATLAGWYDRLHPEDRAPITETLEAYRGRSEPLRLTYRMRHAEGSYRTWIERGLPICDEHGTVQRIVGSCTDITEQQASEQALRESESRFREIFENMSSGVAIYEAVDDGADFVFQDINPAGARIGQLPREDHQGQRLLEKYPGVRDLGLFEVLQAVWRTGEPRRHPVASYDDNRIAIWVENYVCKLPSGEVVAIYDDVTERKRAEQALNHRLVALTQPLADTAGIEFSDLFNVDEIQALQDEFAEATGVASIITRPDGTPITDPSNFCRLCQDIIRQTEKGRCNCFASNAITGRCGPEGPTVQPCLSGGLWDAGAAITVGGKHVANWLIGQVRDETQTEERIREYAREIGANEEDVVEAFHEVPAMSRDQFERVARALFTLAQQLSTSAYQNVQQARFIAERKEAEQNLQEANQRLANTLESISDGFFTLDHDMVVRYYNRSAAELLRRPREQVLNRPLLDAFPEARGTIFEERYRRALLTRKPDTFETHYERTELANWYDVRVYPFEDGISVYFRITTEYRETQRRLQEHEQREKERIARELDKLRDELVKQTRLATIGQIAASIAHELRNPLGAARNATYILKRRLPAEQLEALRCSEYLDMIDQEINAADRIISNLMEMSRPKEPTKQVMDLEELVGHAWSRVGAPDTARWECTAEPRPFQVCADQLQLGQVLANLLNNALQAMAGEGVIYIDARHDSDYDVIVVSDSGPGVPADSRARLFEPLFSTKAKGTGLGLAICRQIIERHGGTITYLDPDAHAEVGPSGATFRICLPRVPARADKQPVGG